MSETKKCSNADCRKELPIEEFKEGDKEFKMCRYCREKKKIKRRKYVAKYPEKIQAQRKKYYQENIEEIHEHNVSYGKKRYEENKEEIKKENKRLYEENKEERLADAKIYRDTHKEEIKLHVRGFNLCYTLLYFRFWLRFCLRLS